MVYALAEKEEFMDRKFNVSLEAEELLIEKGYPIEKAEQIYNERGDVIGCYPYDMPTKSEAIDWLDSKGKIIEVLQDYKGRWFYIIKKSCVGGGDVYFSSRLEAEDAAIIKACELL